MSDIPVVNYNSTKNSKVIDPKWWNYDEEAAHSHVVCCCKAIEDRQSYRAEKNVLNARLYSNQFLTTLSRNIYAKPERQTTRQSKLTLNVVKAAIDTASAKIAKNRPRPLFLTDRGNWTQRQRAKKLTQYMAGLFREARVYENSQLAFRDCGIFGTGFVKLYSDGTKICSDRILPDEVIVDDSEGIYGAPRTMYHRRFVHRDVLLGMVPKDEKKMYETVLNASVGGGQNRPDETENEDMIYTVEAWHLPSTPEGDDGKHVLAIEEGTILIEDYKKDYFPIFHIHWTPPVIGFYGSGIPEDITGIQLEINKLLRDIQMAMHRMCAPQIWIEAASHVTKPITNEFGAIYRYVGQPPKFYAPAAMSTEVYNHVWNLYKRAFEIVGVSEMAATLKKPAGLESRAALREYNEIETERFALTAIAYEEFHMSIARAAIDMSRDLYEENSSLSVNVEAKVPGSKFIQSIAWEDVSLEDDQFVMDVFPTSLLPSTPSGKLNTVQELMESGLIDKNRGMALLDFPDVDDAMSLETASLEVIQMMVGEILENGNYSPPEQFMDLALTISEAQKSYLRAKMEGAPEENLELLQRFMNQAITLLKGTQPPTPQPMPAGPPPMDAGALMPPAAPPMGAPPMAL